MASRNRMGNGFKFGATHVWVGPGPRGHRFPAVLAFQREDEAEPTTVADFRSATAADLFVDMLNKGVDELNDRQNFETAAAVAAASTATAPAHVGDTPDSIPTDLAELADQAGITISTEQVDA